MECTVAVNFPHPNAKNKQTISEYDQPHESQTNKDIMETLNRKGMGNFAGPDSPEGDADYPLAESPGGDGGGGGGGGGSGGGGGGNSFQLMQERNNQVNNAAGE